KWPIKTSVADLSKERQQNCIRGEKHCQSRRSTCDSWLHEATCLNMELPLFWKGLALGFSIAAPVGPIGLLCIRRSLVLGPKHGLITGLGAATADALYGSIAAFGLSFLTSVLVAQQLWTRLIGGVFLSWLGVSIFLSKPDESRGSDKSSSLFRSYLSSLGLTITNPMTI